MHREYLNLVTHFISSLNEQRPMTQRPILSTHKSQHVNERKLIRARVKFSNKLGELLSRPITKSHQCRICGHINNLNDTKPVLAKCIFSGHDLIRFTCCNCGGIFGPVQLICCEPRKIAKLDKCLYTFYSEGNSTAYQEKTFYFLNPSPQGEYINYACGDWSNGIRRLRELDWDIIGYEPFQKIEAPSIYTKESLESAKKYDGLMSHNYIEHVQDPTIFFKKCYTMIKQGGKMVHSSPCFEYLYEVSPLHLFFYCGNSVNELAKRTGFRVISHHSSGMELPGHQYICYIFARTA